MTEEQRKQLLADATAALNTVQASAYEMLKPHGFRKHGRLFHRFVEGDISQVVEIQRGQAYREETHLFWVNVGIRVPECQLRSFAPGENTKKYYHEYECNMRWTLGEESKRKTGVYNLRKPLEPMIEDILHRLEGSALPMFEVLCSRDAILEKRTAYPQLWPNHPLLDSALIYGRRGEVDQAMKQLLAYGCEVESADFRQRYPNMDTEPKACLQALAARFHIDLAEPIDNPPEA